ncbi:MAG: hypothetical protein N0E58_16760 [Candidatus Thiodiazotropha endolucinida]|uniref:Uncharacterized protein n=1 Tax=Candidatus Thiodiazotropha taylori TaxID=2792791 RepID=A0A9E4NMA9_9GAMM|nr:hypothetical protein [Candidatus Thiodiazotropha sp. (ex Codakia orbicularis)]MBV2123902.1 hypothetical protein [Candidatus Thiodiazotropha taylori]MCG7979770.1 hypothetical protein [Candidatus Thiodiazotropha taylori]MCW4237900.1 hypothetical protein [Candidatus Thiodiazotropha endolucinida]
MKITRIKEGLITLAFLPIFLYQFVHLMSWIAAEPIENIGQKKLDYDSIPEDTQSFYINHGDAIFSAHATIKEEPVLFGLWVALFVVTIIVYTVVILYAKRSNT